MCGLIGIASGVSVASRSWLAAGRDKLRHRGPDGAGEWWSDDGRVGLAHRRLSIIDLSPAAQQPMFSSCGRFVIVFNGEVYNYVELKSELQALGHTFRGSGDTEVVLAAFVQWGDACLSRFNGMFALAVYDHGTSAVPPSLFLARDRAGKKPLYYSKTGEALLFASELKAMPPEVRGAPDLLALNYYLALGYVPGALSIAAGVAKLQPGHAARFRMDNRRLQIWRWWALPARAPAPVNDVEALAEEAEVVLRDAVRVRMRSDVPVGVLLSGGLDSSLIVACAAQLASRPVKTFTMALPGSALNESGYADVVARHFGTDHHVLDVSAPALAVLDEIAPFVDEPIADSSLIPAYLVAKLTAEHVKVALGGDGGDELFGGYSDYTTACMDHERFGWLPPWAFRLAGAMASVIPPGVPGRNRVYALRGGPFQSLVWGSPYFDAAARRRILKDDAVAELGSAFLAPELFRLALFQTGSDPVDSMTRTHFGSILPDDFLVKVDRASMAVSLEMRSPFLDVRLIEFAFGRLPSQWKVEGRHGRRLQKRLAERLLPPTLDLERKQGFSVPMNDWLRGSESPWNESLCELLPEAIDRGCVRKLVTGHARGRTNGARLFALIMLCIAIRNLSGVGG